MHIRTIKLLLSILSVSVLAIGCLTISGSAGPALVLSTTSYPAISCLCADDPETPDPNDPELVVFSKSEVHVVFQEMGEQDHLIWRFIAEGIGQRSGHEYIIRAEAEGKSAPFPCGWPEGYCYRLPGAHGETVVPGLGSLGSWEGNLVINWRDDPFGPTGRWFPFNRTVKCRSGQVYQF